MNRTQTKIKFVFLPLAWLSIIFILAYSLLYWLLWIRFEIIPIKEDIVKYWIPIGLSSILIWLLLRRRIHLLKLDKNDGRIRTLYYMVAVFVLVAPAIFLMSFLDTAAGKLTNLNSITEISQKPLTKFYTVNSYVLQKDYIGIEATTSYSGKNNQYLNFDIYIALPFIGDLFDTLRSPTAFLYVKYHEQISSKINDAERDAKWDSFWDESFKNFDNDLIHFKYLARIVNNDQRDNTIIAARKSHLYKPGSAVIILKPVDEPWGKRNGHKLAYAFLSFGIGVVVWFMMIIIPGLHEDKVKKFASSNKTYIRKELSSIYETIKPRTGFTATPILGALNVLIFVVMVFKGLGFVSFYTRDLIHWGALYNISSQDEWWRFLTSMFLHDGLMHLFMNILSLCLAGVFLENFIGTKKFLIGYFTAGIAAGIISLWWHDRPFVAVGASGAIFGLYGILLALIISRVFDVTLNKFLLTLLACTAGYSLFMGFLSEGIDNSAHIGGLLAGLLTGFVYARSLETKPSSNEKGKTRKAKE